MKEKNEKVIVIPEVDATTFREVLEFLYSGKITLTLDNVVPIITAAEKFQITDLKQVCYDSFNSVVTEQNVIQLLLVAEMCNETTLKKLSMGFILKHYDEVKQTADFRNFITAENKDLLMEIFDQLSPQQKHGKKRKA